MPLPLLDNSWLPGSPDPASGQHVVAVTGTVRLEAGYPAVELYASHASVLHSRTYALASASASYAHGEKTNIGGPGQCEEKFTQLLACVLPYSLHQDLGVGTWVGSVLRSQTEGRSAQQKSAMQP